MSDIEDLKAKLDGVGTRIEAVRKELKLKELFHKDHQATADELAQRYKILADELKNEVDTLETKGSHVDGLEKAVLTWMNSLNFDH